MTDDGSRYVLATGEDAEHRLRLVHSVHGPDTERLLRQAGLAPGMRVADLGCGVGMITAWIARQVGPSGRVTAVDVSEAQVARARQRVEALDLRNVEFVVAPADRTGLPREAFDLVFCRFLLMHLADPAAAVREMRELVRPGGTLACEDGDFTRPFSEPPSAALQRCFELYRAVGDARGVDFRIGPKLYRMFLEASFPAPHVALAQPVVTRGETKRLPEWTLTESASAIIDAGLATESDIRTTARELEAFTADDTTLIGMVQVTQVWARKGVQRAE